MLIRAGVLDLSVLKSLKGDYEQQEKNYKKKNEYQTMFGVPVKITSQRYEVFQKSIKCSCCGLMGSFLAVEKNHNDPSPNYHINLYGVKDGEEILFTKDHIKPKSKGGKNNIDNYQTMCFECNIKKGGTYGE